MKSGHILLALVVLSGNSARHAERAVAQSRPPAAAGIEGITAERIAGHIGVLADDSLRGRGTPSRGLDAAARYVARQFELAGLRPVAGSGLVVRWPLVTTPRVKRRIRLEARDRKLHLADGTDFAVMPAGAEPVTGVLLPVTDLRTRPRSVAASRCSGSRRGTGATRPTPRPTPRAAPGPRGWSSCSIPLRRWRWSPRPASRWTMPRGVFRRRS